MIIKKLILNGYKRFFLNRIRELEYTPDKSMQIILGANGSGKSQLLRQLNPLPANIKQEFYDNGFKHIEIEHNGKNYTLLSTTKHSFKVDNEELNPGGTKKVQLELVKEHFNITPEIVDILLNNTRLTTMSPYDRKRWISELSTIDYRYSISVFNKLKQRHRDIIGGIKLLQDEIIKSEANKLTEENVNKLKKNKEVLSEYYGYISSLYDHNILEDKSKSEIEFKRVVNETKELLTNVNKINLEELNKNYNIIDTNISNIENNIKSIVQELEQAERIPQLENIEELKKKYIELTTKVKQYEENNIYKLDPTNVNTYIKSYSDMYTMLVPNINTLTDYKQEREITPDKKANNDKLILELKNGISSYKLKVKLATEEIEHLDKLSKSDDKITCPNCDHKFVSGYDPYKKDKLVKLIEECNSYIKKYEEHLTKYEDISRRLEELDKIKLDIKTIISQYLELKPILSNILDKFNINTSTPIEIITQFDIGSINLQKLIGYEDTVKELTDITNKIKNYESVKELHTKFNKDKIEQLKTKLEESTRLKNDLIAKKSILANEIKIGKTLTDNYNTMYNYLRTHKTNLNNQIKRERNKHLLELTQIIKEEIVNIDQQLSLALQYTNKYTKDKQLLEDYKTKEKVLRLMVKELSPTEGLIAKSINSFLNVFITEINTIINKVWSYEIQLLPCEITEDNDLDYKFKVMVNNDEVIEDVGKLSSSMKEIVDLAFRIVFCKYMGLVDVPLYLDEFGHTMDKGHILQAYRVIDSILKSNYSQVFLISHFSEIYGNIKDCDFNVLNSNNIDISMINDINNQLKIK